MRFVPYFVTPEGLAHFASLAREIDAGCVRSISIDQLHIKPQAADMTASLSAGLFRALFNGTRDEAHEGDHVFQGEAFPFWVLNKTLGWYKRVAPCAKLIAINMLCMAAKMGPLTRALEARSGNCYSALFVTTRTLYCLPIEVQGALQGAFTRGIEDYNHTMYLAICNRPALIEKVTAVWRLSPERAAEIVSSVRRPNGVDFGRVRSDFGGLRTAARTRKQALADASGLARTGIKIKSIPSIQVELFLALFARDSTSMADAAKAIDDWSAKRNEMAHRRYIYRPFPRGLKLCDRCDFDFAGYSSSLDVYTGKMVLYCRKCKMQRPVKKRNARSLVFLAYYKECCDIRGIKVKDAPRKAASSEAAQAAFRAALEKRSK